MKDFKGKVAVVTGGASGIGWGLAERCADEGMKVVIADVEETALKEAGEKLKARGADVLAIPTDVSKLADVQTLARRTLDAYGGVHLLFNNAGVQAGRSVHGPVWENTITDWEWLIGVNLWGVIYGIKVFMPIMLGQKSEGHIVNTSSMAGLIADAQLVIYSATKAAVIKISEGLYLQLKSSQSKISASVLCPAFVSSKLSDAERNRPASMKDPNDGPAPSGTPSFIARLNQNSLKVLTPEESAEIVFQAIKNDTFYIFTDPLVARLFKQRADNILAGKNPERPLF